MATIELFNTLTGTDRASLAADGTALRMYCCGPTVYDYGHIGNFRTFLHVDVLRRLSGSRASPSHHVMNVTDVDDKIIRNAAAAGLPIAEYTAKFEQAFFEDLDALGIEHPEHIARATEYIPDMVALIEQLAAKDIAYRAEDGSWYFRIARFPEYGKLSKKDFEGIEDGARVDVDEYDKDAARDFALWKAAKPGETSWETALGAGRPGWHIECSAMAMKFLGDDLRPPRRRRRPHVPAPRERDRPVASPPRTSPSPATGCTSASCSSKARRCRSPRATSTPSATCCSKAIAPRPSASCSSRCPTATS